MLTAPLPPAPPAPEKPLQEWRCCRCGRLLLRLWWPRQGGGVLEIKCPSCNELQRRTAL